ncbi:MAG TPA: hypothetical protein VIL66_09380 [Bacillota bacterium]
MRKHPIRFFLFVILIQVLLVFSLHAIARSADLPYSTPEMAYFALADIDQNTIPDHLTYTVQLDHASIDGQFWLCGELQALINGQWQTIAYTGCHFPDAGQVEKSAHQNSSTATLYFYGGEIKRLKVDGPFRLLVKMKGVGVEERETIAFSPSYKHSEFEESNLVWVQGRKEKISTVVETVKRWALEQNLSLGILTEVTYNFDRWRLDYQGTSTVKAKRVWVDPGGEISWVNIE